MTTLEDAARRASNYVAEHGPVLNVVTTPCPKCGTCGQRSPVSVHHLAVVWLGCGHTTDLPPLPSLRGWRAAPSVIGGLSACRDRTATGRRVILASVIGAVCAATPGCVVPPLGPTAHVAGVVRYRTSGDPGNAKTLLALAMSQAPNTPFDTLCALLDSIANSVLHGVF